MKAAQERRKAWQEISASRVRASPQWRTCRHQARDVARVIGLAVDKRAGVVQESEPEPAALRVRGGVAYAKIPPTPPIPMQMADETARLECERTLLAW